MKKTVYIIGATEGFSKLNLPDFNVIEGFLDKRDFDSVKPHDLFDQMDNNILSHQEQMQRRFNAIEECDMCIVMPNHHLCSYARAEVYHARHHYGGLHSTRFIQRKTLMEIVHQAKPKRELSDTELRVRSMTKANDPRRGKGKRILQEHRAELNSIVTSFLKSIPQNGTVDDYTEQYLVHNNRWKQHCQNMNKRYEWMNADATLFERNVELAQRKMLRQKRPLQWLWLFYIKRALPLFLLSAAIYIIYEFIYLPIIN